MLISKIGHFSNSSMRFVPSHQTRSATLPNFEQTVICRFTGVEHGHIFLYSCAAQQAARNYRRGGRAVECTGLENQQGLIALRGFESHPLRQITNPPSGGFFICQKGWVRGNCRKAASGFDKNAGRPLSRIPALRGTGASMHNAFLHERSEPGGQGTGRYPVIPPSPPNNKPASWHFFIF